MSGPYIPVAERKPYDRTKRHCPHCGRVYSRGNHLANRLTRICQRCYNAAAMRKARNRRKGLQSKAVDRIALTDDGTLDTVVECRDCGTQTRYSFTAWPGEGGEAAYLAFADWCRSDMAERHTTCCVDCPVPTARPCSACSYRPGR